MRRLTYLWPYAAFLAIALGGWFFARPEFIVPPNAPGVAGFRVPAETCPAAGTR